MYKWLIALFIILFAGCAAGPPLSSIKFQKDGTTTDDFKRASYECISGAQVNSPTGCYVIREREKAQKTFYIHCMEQKGWHLAE
jgi:hypothetical protein